MKRFLPYLFIFFSFSAFAQVTTDIKVDCEIEGSAGYSLTKPDYYPIAGKVVLIFSVSKTTRNPFDIYNDEKESTVKDYSQISSCKDALRESWFSLSSEASDTVKGRMVYTITDLSPEQLTAQQTRIQDAIYKQLIATAPERFKLYRTDNMWTFLELDTVYGYVYKVQYGTQGDEYRYRHSISREDLRESSYTQKEEYMVGRFDLYQTQNMYNFILLDKVDGRTWQVQWSVHDDNDGLFRIR